MSRHAREVIPGLPHHVIFRGNNRRNLFSYPNDYRQFVRLVGKALAKRDECRLHALTVMTNHVHAIVTPAAADALAKLVHSVLQRYAQYRNARRAGTGKLFEERFLSWPIRTEARLADVTAYIDMNPVSAGIVSDPLAYPWSTYAIHAGHLGRCRIPLAVWTPSPWYLALGSTPAERATQYRAFIPVWRSDPDRVQMDPAVEKAEAASHLYTLRLERPDRTRASEPVPPYGTGGQDPGI